MENEKSHINNLRYRGLVKGRQPFVCQLAKSTNSFGKISLKYIISCRDNTIYFQSLDFFSEVPNKKHDYEIDITELKKYRYNLLNKSIISCSLVTKKRGFINLLINTTSKKRYYSQIVFKDFLAYLNNNGIKDEVEEDRQINKEV